MKQNSVKLYSHYFTVIPERLASPEKELRGSPTTAEDKGDRPRLARTQTYKHTRSFLVITWDQNNIDMTQELYRHTTSRKRKRQR